MLNAPVAGFRVRNDTVKDLNSPVILSPCPLPHPQKDKNQMLCLAEARLPDFTSQTLKLHKVFERKKNLIRSFRRTVEPPITNPLLIKPLFMKSFPKPFPWYFHVNRSMTKDRPFQGRFAWVLGWLELNGSTVSLQYLEDLERFWLQCVTFAHQIYFRDSARVVSDCICIKLFTCICLNPLVYT